MTRQLLRVISHLCRPLLRQTVKIIQRLLCFTCCKVTPKKQQKKASLKLLSLAELLNPLLHHSNWMCARKHLAACHLTFFLFFFFSHPAHRWKHLLPFFLQPWCISPPDGRSICPLVSDALSVLTGRLLFMPLLTSCAPLERQMDACNTRFSPECWIVCFSE